MSVPVPAPRGYRLLSYSKRKLGNARFRVHEWDFRFEDGQLKVVVDGSPYAIFLGEDETEEFITIIRALDQGRFLVTWEKAE